VFVSSETVIFGFLSLPGVFIFEVFLPHEVCENESALRKMANTNQEVYQICTDEKFRRLHMKLLTVFMFREIRTAHVFHEHEMNMNMIFFRYPCCCV
jgi:hypothetical protein